MAAPTRRSLLVPGIHAHRLRADGPRADREVVFATGRFAGIVLVLLAIALLGSAPTLAQVPAPPPPPAITSIGPAVLGPGESIRIRGRNFVDVRTVSLAGLPLKARVRSRTLIVARAPRSAVRGTVVVATGGGTAVSPRAVVVRPSLSVEPARSPIGGTVTLRGSGFIPGEPIDFYHGRLAAGAGTADRGGNLPPTPMTVPPQATPGGSFVRAQGRFSGIPVDVPHTVGLDWSQRGFVAEGNRYNRVELSVGATLIPTLVLDWIVDTIGPARSSPAVVEGVVYVGADTGALLAFPADCASGGATCPVTRALGVTRGAISSSPAVAGSVVYVGSEDGGLYAFDTTCAPGSRPCEPLWVGRTEGAVTSSPVVADGLVVVGSTDGRVYAFSQTCEGPECAPAWVGRTGGSVRSSPAVQDGVAYVGSEEGSLHAFDLDCARDGGTCSPLWRGRTGAAVRSSPAVASGIVYVGSADGKVHGFPVGCASGGRDCPAIWLGVADGPVESSPVVAEGKVVVGTMAGSVMAFPVACPDTEAGCAPVWTARTGGPVRSSPAVGGAAAGGAVVVAGSDDGFLYGYRLNCPATCVASWAAGTRDAISASPAFVDGVVYAASEDGTVRAWSLP